MLRRSNVFEGAIHKKQTNLYLRVVLNHKMAIYIFFTIVYSICVWEEQVCQLKQYIKFILYIFSTDGSVCPKCIRAEVTTAK